MALPEEYKLLEIVGRSNNIVTHKASHPIHGIVAIYKPEDGMPDEIAIRTRRFLYRCGTQMRSISLLNLPYVVNALEVSQNPNEPYIVTKLLTQDLEELTNNGTTLKPKRTFQIISQLLQAISSLSENGWQIDHLDLGQIKFNDYYNDDVTLVPIGTSGLQSNVTKTVISPSNKPSVAKPAKQDAPYISEDAETVANDNAFEATIAIDNAERPVADDSAFDATIAIDDIEKTIAMKKPGTQSGGHDAVVTVDQTEKSSSSQGILRADQRTIYMMGNIAFQLMLGGKYKANDDDVTALINKVEARWQKILKKSLDQDINCKYQTLDVMLGDIQNSLMRNKKIAAGAALVLIAAIIVAGFFGYKQYKRRKIMTSDTATAVKNLAEIFDEDSDATSTDAPEDAGLSDDEILQPFEEVEKTDQ